MALVDRFSSSAGSATNGGSSPGPVRNLSATGVGVNVVANDLIKLTGATGGRGNGWFLVASRTNDNEIVLLRRRRGLGAIDVTITIA